MAQDHRLQPQRFELKYLVAAELTRGIRDFIGSYLELDDYSAAHPDRSYTIHSVYLDSPGLHTYHATRNGDKNRFKLRLRYYGDAPSPVFFEIKRRVDSTILKERCPVRRDAVPLLLSGQLPEPGQILSQEPRHLVALQRFQLLQHRLRASTRLHNTYQREAWVTPGDNSVRVTFDRDVRIEPYFRNQAVITSPPHRIYREFVILEFKFTMRYPNWFRELVACFNLVRATSSKYCGGIELLGEHPFARDAEGIGDSTDAGSEAATGSHPD
jgi:hypothetical protein